MQTKSFIVYLTSFEFCWCRTNVLCAPFIFR